MSSTVFYLLTVNRFGGDGSGSTWSPDTGGWSSDCGDSGGGDGGSCD